MALEDENSGDGLAIRLARSDEEHAAVRRFWYEVYCVVRGVLRDKADHIRRELDDPFLRKGYLHMATDGRGICGTVLTTYGRDTALEPYASFYELERVPGYPHRVSITTKLMVRPDVRGTNVVLHLLRASYHLAFRRGVERSVFDCNDPVYALFKSMGARDLHGRKSSPDFGDVHIMEMPVTGNERALARGLTPKDHQLRSEQSAALSRFWPAGAPVFAAQPTSA
jgi:hypothetical protein